jgi:hypothetical protein
MSNNNVGRNGKRVTMSIKAASASITIDHKTMLRHTTRSRDARSPDFVTMAISNSQRSMLLRMKIADTRLGNTTKIGRNTRSISSPTAGNGDEYGHSSCDKPW